MPPQDGWAYTPIELTAIAHMTVDFADIVDALAKPYEFHAKCEQLGLPSHLPLTDKDAQDLITRAVLAESFDPDPVYDEIEDTLSDLPEPHNPYGGHA